MSTIFKRFCNEKEAFINPTDFIKSIPGFPEICITTFSQNIINDFIKNNDFKVICEIDSSNGSLPVYVINCDNMSIGLFLSRVGAPACAAGLEEVIALGAKKIIQFGCCGILNESLAGDKIIIPVSAVRDEGTSYHYLPESEEIIAEPASIMRAVNCLQKHKIPYVKGKVWTTDAIYRETKSLIKERKEQGCLAVDMECSASLAVAKFRNVPMIQFFFGADSLDSPVWDQRDLTDYGAASANKYMSLAFKLARALEEENVQSIIDRHSS